MSINEKYKGKIYETTNLILIAHQNPNVCRTDGGHLKIVLKNPVKNRTELDPVVAIEIMRFTMICGEAMTLGLAKSGIILKRINYQDNGNWFSLLNEPEQMHIHLYGRTGTETKQKRFPSSLYFPDPADVNYYKDYEPLNEQDCENIKVEIERLFKKDKYKDSAWGL